MDTPPAVSLLFLLVEEEEKTWSQMRKRHVVERVEQKTSELLRVHTGRRLVLFQSHFGLNAVH